MGNNATIYIADSRNMQEVDDQSIQLIVTSPPYWSIKNYEKCNQIGYGQTLHQYLQDLYRVWSECFRVLEDGRRLVVNIGDQFARSVVYGRYKIIPLHAEIIAQCEQIGFDYMGSIIWQKKTTMNTTGGATVMGSYPYPPNGMVEIDYEHILLFKKPGKSRKIPKEIKEKSKLTKEEWKEYFSGHWSFGGAKQTDHQAMFPEELPKRVIKMFSFVGETILDPFLGSGTTAKVALELERNVIGYEINEEYRNIIKNKVRTDRLDTVHNTINFVFRDKSADVKEEAAISYVPSIQDAKPIIEPEKFMKSRKKLHTVVAVLDDGKIALDTGQRVKFQGVKFVKKDAAISYLKQFVLKKRVYLEFDSENTTKSQEVEAYVYLKNKIFINAYLIKSGYGVVDSHASFTRKNHFIQMMQQTKEDVTN